MEDEEDLKLVESNTLYLTDLGVDKEIILLDRLVILGTDDNSG